MKLDLEFLPMVGTAAGVLAGLQLKHKCLVVDHLTIHRADPKEWDQIYLLAAETTFNIRRHMERLGDKLVVICTSDEPGLDCWPNFFFPHWLMAVADCNRNYVYTPWSMRYKYDALLGRAKDPRTRLLQSLDAAGMLQKGIISYNSGVYYSAKQDLDPSPYYSSIWEWEDADVRNLYENEIAYRVSLDSTTRLHNGHFHSCVIPKSVYESTGVTIVAETDNIGDHVFVTEKTWKPFFAGKSCIFYATPRHEEFLSSLGFVIPFKTRGDPEAVVDVLCGEHYYLGEEIANNQELANPDVWISKLYNWLDQFRT